MCAYIHMILCASYHALSFPKETFVTKGSSKNRQRHAVTWYFDGLRCHSLSDPSPLRLKFVSKFCENVYFSNEIRYRGCHAWWCHQMETFSALLAICAGNSPVPGEFPTQRPVTRSFDVYFDLRSDKRLSKQSWGWWFETLSHSLWRHRNGHKAWMHPQD